MSEHAAENLAEFAKIIPGKKVLEFIAKVKEAVKMDCGSVAVMVDLDKAIANPIRDDWAANDVLAAIIRNHKVVTVMLTRKSQCNKSHMRTERGI